MSETKDILADLRDPDYRGEMQHLRGWDELDRMHGAAAAEIARLRAALLRIDTLRASSGKTDAEMLYEIRSIAKAALNPDVSAQLAIRERGPRHNGRAGDTPRA